MWELWSYQLAPHFPRKSNQNNKSAMSGNFMSLFMYFVTVSVCAFTPGYHVPMYFYHTDEASKQAKQGRFSGLQRFLLSFRCQGAPGLRARVLTAGPPGAYFLFRDRIWSRAFRDR